MRFIGFLGNTAYLLTHCTRPASIRKDMHNGRVFLSRSFEPVRSGELNQSFAKPSLTAERTPKQLPDKVFLVVMRS